MTEVTGTEQDNQFYRKDAFVQTWVDRRNIATLIRWLEDSGIPPRFMSEVVNTALSSLVEALVSQGRVKRVHFTKEADELINRTIKTRLNPSGRGMRNYKHNLEVDDLRLEALGRPTRRESAASDLQDEATQEADDNMRREIERLIKGGGDEC